MAYLPTCQIAHLFSRQISSQFKIGLSVCDRLSVLTLATCLQQVLRLLAIIFANYLTRQNGPWHSPPSMKLSSMKPVENQFGGTGQECKHGLLPSFKRNICESLEMQYIIHLDNESMPHIMSLCEALLCCYWCLQQQYVYFRHFCCLICKR